MPLTLVFEGKDIARAFISFEREFEKLWKSSSMFLSERLTHHTRRDDFLGESVCVYVPFRIVSPGVRRCSGDGSHDLDGYWLLIHQHVEGEIFRK